MLTQLILIALATLASEDLTLAATGVLIVAAAYTAGRAGYARR